MANTGKCPGCGETPTSVLVEPIRIEQIGADPRRGASYLCPHCRTILSVEMDPIALAQSLLAELQGMKD